MAIIQVLLMTAVIAVLLLIIANFAQQSIRHAQLVQDTDQQKRQLHTAFNILSLALLTKEWTNTDGSLPEQRWNFYGEPFSFGNVLKTLPSETHLFESDTNSMAAITVVIQDTAGLIKLQQANRYLATLLQKKGASAAQVRQALQELTLAQQVGRSNSVFNAQWPLRELVHISELANLEHFSAELVKGIAPFVWFGSGRFNPAQAPQALLEAILPQAQNQLIKQWRAAGTQNSKNLLLIFSDQQDEFLDFQPDAELLIRLTMPSSALTAVYLVRFTPYNDKPVVVFQYHYLTNSF